MKSDNVEYRLRKVLCEVFELSQIDLPEQPEQKNIEQWDSLGHLRLLMSVEEEFNIHFNTERMPKLLSFKLIKDEIDNIE